MKKEWNVEASGQLFNVVLEKNKIWINNKTLIKLNQLKRSGSMVEYAYELPLGNQSAILYMPGGKAPALSMNGMDVDTGKPHIMRVLPAWAWIFTALYVINFLLIMNDVIGGAIAGACLVASNIIAADKKMTTGLKVMICVLMYLAVTVAMLFVSGLAFKLIGLF